MWININTKSTAYSFLTFCSPFNNVISLLLSCIHVDFMLHFYSCSIYLGFTSSFSSFQTRQTSFLIDFHSSVGLQEAVCS